MTGKTFVVIPTYCEANNISLLLETLHDIFTKNQIDYCIVIVDDNSSDGTVDFVHKFNTQYNNTILIEREGKLGLGSATREGMKTALASHQCQRIITMDADFSHNPLDIPRLIAHGGDLVIGSRYVTGGKIYGWKLHRKLISWGANTFCRLFLKTEVKDNTANFRLYSASCAEASLEAKGRDFEWIVSALITVKKKGFKAHEIPVTFINRKLGASKLSLHHLIRWLGFLFTAPKQN